MSRFALAPLALCLTLICTQLGAQSMVGEPEFIRVQRQAIEQDRQAVMSAYALAAQACWQKFAVNACLSDARKTRRAALEPLRQQDLELNTQERLWRTDQRDQRLQIKQPDGRVQP